MLTFVSLALTEGGGQWSTFTITDQVNFGTKATLAVTQCLALLHPLFQSGRRGSGSLAFPQKKCSSSHCTPVGVSEWSFLRGSPSASFVWLKSVCDADIA